MIKEKLNEIVTEKFNQGLSQCSDEQIYESLLVLAGEQIKKSRKIQGGKKLYYISAEFLIGKLLSNNLINLGIYEEVRNILAENGKDLSTIEAIEPEPSLGNGGLGRLAACFLDSIATLGLNGDGVGLNYHFGLFRQVFEDYRQNEEKNPWITQDGWLNKTEVTFPVKFGKYNAISRMYDIDVVGYDNGINHLHLFDIESVDETIVKKGIDFDKEAILKNLTLFLYPDDSDRAGNVLRIYQQYFMVSNAAQLVLKECKENGIDLKKLNDHVVIQINDTHPTMVIPELIRLLTAEGLTMDEAIAVTEKTCAYTNHTILAEALEKWPLEYLEEVVPHLVPIIKVLDKRIKEMYQDPAVDIIDKDERVHMAHLDIHYGFSVNGVAALHTEILKETELNAFYQLYPEKFNNKTNGITFRRWLLHANPRLADFITELIGDGYKKDALQLEQLANFADNRQVQEHLLSIKAEAKLDLKNYLQKTEGITINENSIFDIQIKRLHEYKRQQMNVLYIIHKYLEIKAGNIPARPLTVIFGAKAAPAYVIAKDIIHLILCLQELINHDPEVSPYLNVVMTENYNVSKAEKLIPACDISEQISLASKEASGTGNMKFMLNGAITLGTMDGANVEINDLVGPKNIYIFGETSEQVINHYQKADYNPKDYYSKDQNITACVDFILSKELQAIGDKTMLTRLHNELITKDWFMTLLDLKAYIQTKEQALNDYENRSDWARKMLINISKAGYFSSDRTIEEYNKDIWHLK